MKISKIKIVMVEDDAIDAEITEHFLEREGLHCEIERVETHCALESALRAAPPDVILCDLTLPAFSGLEALDIAQRVAPDTPFIFFSGHTHGPMAEAARARGSAVLSKDNYKHLASLLRKAIASAQPRDTLSATSAAPATQIAV